MSTQKDFPLAPYSLYLIILPSALKCLKVVVYAKGHATNVRYYLSKGGAFINQTVIFATNLCGLKDLRQNDLPKGDF